ncbi:MAG: Fe(3+) ABC transporter substrate-binding protein [Rhizobiaceae bacterium]
MNTRKVAVLLGSMSLAALFAHSTANAEQVNIYSYRQPELIKPLTDAFTAKTGITANVLFLDKGLEERIEAEGANSPADVILSVDIGKVVIAKEKGLTAPLDNPVIEAAIPAEFRDSANQWFGLTTRGRVVYASRDRVGQDSITYEELADPKWKGRICIRDGQHSYNLGLFASMIAHKGAEEAEKWLSAVKQNLARRPAGNDREQAKSIHSGECDIAIGNTYYVGLMMTNDKEPEQKDWAKSIKVLFPNADDRGTHVNISAMALVKTAPNRDSAIKLMEFLSSAKAQEIYAAQVFEYPVMPGAQVSDLVKSFGTLKADRLRLEEIAKYRKLASELVDKTGFNDGPGS